MRRPASVNITQTARCSDSRRAINHLLLRLKFSANCGQALTPECIRRASLNHCSAPNRGARNIAMSVSVCVCVFVCLSAIISPELHVRSSPIFFVKCYRLRCALGELRSIIYRHRRRRCHLLHRNAAHIIQNKTRCSSVVCDR